MGNVPGGNDGIQTRTRNGGDGFQGRLPGREAAGRQGVSPLGDTWPPAATFGPDRAWYYVARGYHNPVSPPRIEPASAWILAIVRAYMSGHKAYYATLGWSSGGVGMRKGVGGGGSRYPSPAPPLGYYGIHPRLFGGYFLSRLTTLPYTPRSLTAPIPEYPYALIASSRPCSSVIMRCSWCL
jgi:hypothetical protein